MVEWWVERLYGFEEDLDRFDGFGFWWVERRILARDFCGLRVRSVLREGREIEGLLRV